MEENNQQNYNQQPQPQPVQPNVQPQNMNMNSNMQKTNFSVNSNSVQGGNSNANSNNVPTGNFNVSSQMPPKKKGKGIKVFAIIAIILIIAIVAGLAYYFMYYTKPEQIYKRLISNSINEYTTKASDGDYKTVKSSIKLTADVDADEEMADMINKSDIKLETQIDKENKKAVLKLDTNLNNKSLINAQIYTDAKDEKTYIYLKDLLNKYIEIDKGYLKNDKFDLYEIINKLFSNQENKKINSEKGKKILEKELLGIVKPEYCSSSKEDVKIKDKTVSATKNTIKMTSEQLEKECTTIINDLKSNEEFLNEFEDKDKIKEVLESILDEGFKSENDDEKMEIEFNVYTQGLMNDVVKVSISSHSEKTEDDNVEISAIVVKKDVYDFEIKVAGKTEANGTITLNKENDNEGNVKLEFNAEDFGKVTFNIEYSKKYNEDIDNVNSKNTVKLENLTSADQKTFMTNFQKSELGQLITSFTGLDGQSSLNSNTSSDSLFTFDSTNDDSFGINTNKEDEDEDEDNNKTDKIKDNELLTYNNKTKITFNVPEGYKVEKISDNMKTMDKGNIYATISTDGSSDKSKYYKELQKKADNYKSKEGYIDVNLSNPKSTEVNGTKFYMSTLSYKMKLGSTESKFSNRYIWTELKNEYVYYIEINDNEEEMTQSDLKEMLNIKVEDVK